MDVLSCNCGRVCWACTTRDGLLSLPGVARVWVMRTGTLLSAAPIMLSLGIVSWLYRSRYLLLRVLLPLVLPPVSPCGDA